MPDILALLRPLGEVQCHGRRLDRCARIFFEDNPCAQRPHGRVGDALVTPGRPMSDAELDSKVRELAACGAPFCRR